MKLWILAICVLFSGCVALVETGPFVETENGVVVCVDSIASNVGVEIMQKGGNAVDAAISVAFTLAVTHPQAGNLGGGGFMLIKPMDGEVTSIDYRERAPMAATQDMYLKPDGTVDKIKSTYGFYASGVPGTVAGFYLAYIHYGSGELTWHELLEPACVLAETGFVVDFDLAKAFKKHEKNLRRFPQTVKTYFRPDGSLPKLGDRLVQADLGKTLRAIQNGGQDGFYKGWVGKELIRSMQKEGGVITARDLETYSAKERKPMHLNYRGIDIYAMGLPSSGGPTLFQMLNILYGYQLKPMEDSLRAHVMAEAMRRGFKDRALHMGDPEFTSPPFERLLSKDFAMKVREGINIFKATPSQSLTPNLLVNKAPDKETRRKEQGGGQTTHFCVADKDGVVVSNTYTLEQTFGCKAVAGNTGVLMNNEMHDFNLRPGFTCESGAIGTEPNLISPGKRMLSSMTPVILLKDKEPYAAFGSPGGRTIINTVLQVVVNLVDLGMTLEQAIDAPRIHHQWFPDRIYVEKKLPTKIKEGLKDRGHTLIERDFQGDCHGLFFPAWELTHKIQGVADSRIDGCAVGF